MVLWDNLEGPDGEEGGSGVQEGGDIWDAFLSLSLYIYIHTYVGFPDSASSKEPACQCRCKRQRVQYLDQEDPPEEGMATHSSILAYRIPWMEEPGGLPSIGLQRVGRD